MHRWITGETRHGGGSSRPRVGARSRRRGALMTGAVLGVAVLSVLLTMLMQAELGRLRVMRNQARAQQVAEIAALFDLYVHQNRAVFGAEVAVLPEQGKVLSQAEQADFERQYLDGVLAPALAGFEVGYLVGLGPEGSAVTGYVHLMSREDPGYSDLPGLLDALETSGLVSGPKGISARDRLLAGSDRVVAILDRPLEVGEAALATPPLSGLSAEYVLRMPRAGQFPPVFADGSGAFDMAGHDVVNGGRVAAEQADIADIEGDFFGSEAEGSLENVAGALRVSQRISAGGLALSGQLQAGRATALALQVPQVEVAGPAALGSATSTGLIAGDLFGNVVFIPGELTGLARVVVGNLFAEVQSNIETMDSDILSALAGDVRALEVLEKCTGC